jgi:RecA/RadA recombinase
MGSSARAKNDMMALVMMRVVRTNCAFLVINHTYDNPGAMYARKYKDMPGGKKLQYSAHVMLQTNKKLIKSVDNDFMSAVESDDADRGYVKGNLFRFFCTKNRVSEPGFECEVYIDFDSGI